MADRKKDVRSLVIILDLDPFPKSSVNTLEIIQTF